MKEVYFFFPVFYPREMESCQLAPVSSGHSFQMLFPLGDVTTLLNRTVRIKIGVVNYLRF